MKMVFFLYSLSQGGAERVVASLANYWAMVGREVTVATIAAADGDVYALLPQVKRVSLGMQMAPSSEIAGVFGVLRRIRRIRALLVRIEPDVAISMMNTANVTLALAGLGLRKVALVGSERIYPPAVPMTRMWSVLRYFSYRYLDAVVAQSEDSARWICTHTRARSVPVVPNPVSLPLPVHDPVVPPRVAGRGGHMILAAGRLEYQKGFDLLLPVFARIAGEYPDWSLCIAGDGPLKATLGAMIEELGLGGRAYLVGSVGNIADWYAASELFVLSSRFEGFPNVLLEALSHGVPAVSFDCMTGPGEVIRHGEDGLLVAPGDLDGLESALRQMIDDPEFRASCAGNARQAAERFSIARVAGLWDMVIREVE